MRRSAAAFIFYLAQQCADPNKAAKAMLKTGERHVKLTKRQITFITLDRLQKRGLGTEDVERGSISLIKNKNAREGDTSVTLWEEGEKMPKWSWKKPGGFIRVVSSIWC